MVTTIVTKTNNQVDHRMGSFNVNIIVEDNDDDVRHVININERRPMYKYLLNILVIKPTHSSLLLLHYHTGKYRVS